MRVSRLIGFIALVVLGDSTIVRGLERVRVNSPGDGFVYEDSGKTFVGWGVNYDHDGAGRLLDEYWIEDWDRVVSDFEEIRELGANLVRVHLQIGLFLDAPDRMNAGAVDQLGRLLELAESEGLYLDITGLACYHKKNIPDWYDTLSEGDRWAAQAFFWENVARVCSESPAVFCYDLMNEPILAGAEPAEEWLGGDLDGKFFVQRITLDLAGRTRREVAKAWVDMMTQAIRRHDDEALITVGVIPWVFVFGGGKPLFYSDSVGENLDFVSVHFYPKTDEIETALEALRAYEVGKPLVIEEMFPLKCGADELETFIENSTEIVDGWVSFYWGDTVEELRAKPDGGIAAAMTASWLERFESLSQTIPAKAGAE